MVELLLSMALGSVILMGVMVVYQGSQGVLATQQALDRIEESGRFVTAVLTEEIRTAGYVGCGRLSRHFPLQSMGIEELLGDDAGLRGFSGGEFGAGFPNNEVPGNDMIRIAKMATTTAEVVAMEPDESHFRLKPAALINTGDVVMMSSCGRGAMFRARSSANGWMTTPKALPGFGVGAMVGEMEQRLFYIGDTRRKTDRGYSIQGLYVRYLDGRTEELVEGIHQMKAMYGVCTQIGGRVNYVSAQEVKDWSKVVLVHLALEIDSVEERGGVYGADSRLRRPWLIDIALRERHC